MPCDEGMSDPDVALLLMSGLARDRDYLDVEIAQKKLELYDLLGVPNNDDDDVPMVPPMPPTGNVLRSRVVTGGDMSTCRDGILNSGDRRPGGRPVLLGWVAVPERREDELDARSGTLAPRQRRRLGEG